MATGSGAFGVNGGYNQSGGGYYIIISSINTQLNVLTPGSGSGGAATVGSFATAGAADLPGATSTLFLGGKIIKDMGKSVVSAGRVFRKVQSVAGSSSAVASLGVVGLPPTASNVGYASFYIETGREGQQGDRVLPAIARYL